MEHVAVGQAGQTVEAGQLQHLLAGQGGGRHVAGHAAVAGEAAAVELRIAADAHVHRLAMGQHRAIDITTQRAPRRHGGAVVGEVVALHRGQPVDLAWLAQQQGGVDADAAHVVRQVGEAIAGVGLPHPVGRQRHQVGQPRLAGLQLLVQLGHLLRGQRL